MKKTFLLLLLLASFQTKAQFIEASLDSFKTRLPIRLMNIGEGAGKVLTSDALGRATWQTPPGGSGLWSVNGAGGNEIQNTNAGGFWSSYSTIVPITADNTSNPPTAPMAGAGTRMMWIPSRSAFRCGTTNGNAWDASNIGLHSFATGYNSRATGTGNVAIGTGAISDGTSNTIAIGENARASENGSMAFGSGAIADGSVRTIAFGENAHAYGTNSVAFGTGTIANAYYSVALGYYNLPIGTANATSWISTDPLLYIGNGQSSLSQSNAMVIQKNGVVNIGVTPTNSTTYRLKLGGSMSATGTVQAAAIRSTNLAGLGERQVCTDESGNLIECQNAGQLSYYNVSALGFHPVLSTTTPASVFIRIVEKALISFANNTKNGDAHAFAPVELPHGARMGKMTMHFMQNTGGTMTLIFYSVGKQTNATGTIEASITSVAGSGIQEKEIDFKKELVIDNSQYYYYLKLEAGANWQGTDMALRGVVFSYTK
jgi:hypothetical protein